MCWRDAIGIFVFFPVFQGWYNGIYIYIYIGGMLLGYGIIVCCRNFKSTRLNPAKNQCAWEKSCFGVLGISNPTLVNGGCFVTPLAAVEKNELPVKWEKIHRPSGLNNVWDSHPEWLFHLSDGTCRKSWNHQPNETSRSFLSVLTISYNIIQYLTPRKSNVSRDL